MLSYPAALPLPGVVHDLTAARIRGILREWARPDCHDWEAAD